MRRGRIFIYLALIIILGIAAAFLWLQRSNQATPDEAGLDIPIPTPVIEDIQVVVVTQNTPRGTLLDETISLPKNDAVDGMFFNDLASVVGRRAKFDLDSGVPLTSSMLVDSAEALSSTGSLAALLIPKGKVAVSIPINRLSSVSYAPMAGDHVSVIVTMLFVDIDSEFQTILPNSISTAYSAGGGGEGQTGPTPITLSVIASDAALGRTDLDPLLNELVYLAPSESQRARLVSQILLPDVTILQVGDFEAQADVAAPNVATPVADDQLVEPSPQPIETAPLPAEPATPDVITLIVSPQDAITLNYLMYSGAELTLALRGAGDDTIEATDSATLQYLIDEYNIDVPAKLPYDLQPRIDQLVQPVLENNTAPANTEGE